MTKKEEKKNGYDTPIEMCRHRIDIASANAGRSRKEGQEAEERAKRLFREAQEWERQAEEFTKALKTLERENGAG